MVGADRENIVGLPKRSPLRGGGRFDDPDQLPWLEAVDEEDEPILSDGRRKFLLIVGALIVLALFGSLLFYVYGQSMRSDPSALDIPVMRAEEGPVKIEPTDRGGLNVPDQDRLVFDRMNGENTDTVAERVTAGPEQPLERPTETTPEAADTDAAATVDTTSAADTPANNASQPITNQQASTPVVDNSAAANVSPSPSQVTPLVTDTQTGELRPANRETVTPNRQPTQQTARVGDGFKIQLGAFGSQGSAEAAWQSLQTQHPNELGALRFELEPLIRVGSPMLFRLRAGVFNDRAGADAACARLQSAGQACFVVAP